MRESSDFELVTWVPRQRPNFRALSCVESWLIPPRPHQVLVSLAHSAVTAEHHKSEKKRSREHLASKLEQGAEIVKAVFSCVPCLFFRNFLRSMR